MTDEKDITTPAPAEPAPKAPAPPTSEFEAEIREKFGADVETKNTINGLEIRVDRKKLLPLCIFLKEHPQTPYEYLRNLTAVDYQDRFEAVYHIGSLKRPSFITVKVSLDHENPIVDSLYPLWSGVDWQEREVYDLLGIRFLGHPDLRRILLPDEWEGHPLRKDYKIEVKEVENWRQAPGQKN